MNELGWKILLCKKRQRQSQADKSDSKENNNIARNEFEADYDRIQTYLFSRVIDEFMEHYNDIMSGKYQAKELLKCEDDFVKALKGIK